MSNARPTPDHLFAYFDRMAGIVWIPVEHSDDVFDQQTSYGSYAYDAATGRKVGFEIWASAEFLPADLRDQLPAPSEKGQSPTGDRLVGTPYWDREVDIAWLPTAHHEGDIVGEERPWGLVIRNRESETTRAVEIWSASSIFPPEIPEAFPEPGNPDEPAGRGR